MQPLIYDLIDFKKDKLIYVRLILFYICILIGSRIPESSYGSGFDGFVVNLLVFFGILVLFLGIFTWIVISPNMEMN